MSFFGGDEGVLGGLAVSTFSKTLALLFGLGIFAVQVGRPCSTSTYEIRAEWFAQWLASRGYNVIPIARVQQYVKGINIRSAVEDNVAFKLSFGTTFALASFASL